MCRRGLLETARDEVLRGDPNVYRLTAVAFGVMGHATVESFQAWCVTSVALEGGNTPSASQAARA